MIQRYRVIILSPAFAELDEIFEFAKDRSPQSAIAITDKLYEAIHSLEIFPHRFKVHQHRTDEALTVRSMPVDNYIVYYRTDEKLHVVRVLSIRHGHRRQPRRFR